LHAPWSLYATGQSAPAQVSSASASYFASVSDKVNSLQSDARSTIEGTVGTDPQNEQRAANGASAVISLSQNGYNPDSPEDNGKVISVIVGGLAALGPATAGVSVLVAGGLEALWQFGNAIACPVSDAFASVGLGTGCNFGSHTTGNFTASKELEGDQPPMPSGSYAQLVMAALAHYTAQQGNCQGGFPPDVIVDAVTAIWNQTHQGPSIQVYVPPLTNSTVNSPIIATGGGTTQINNQTIVNPNITYAFQPMSEVLSSPLYHGNLAAPFGLPSLPAWIGYSPPLGYSPPRTINVNTGPLVKRVVPLHAIPIASTSSAVTFPDHNLPSGTSLEPSFVKLYLPAIAGIGAAFYFSNPLLALAGIGLGFFWNRR